eukprot:8228650-Pyramimonas_sp.AAC.1
MTPNDTTQGGSKDPLHYMQVSLDKFVSWKYRKAILYTIGEILLLYTYPVSSMAAAVGTFAMPAVANPLLDKVRPSCKL